jgi:hypothetical protein
MVAPVGLTIPETPASLPAIFISQEPMDGAVALLVVPLISVVIPLIGVPRPIRFGLTVRQSVLDKYNGLIETELAAIELAVFHAARLVQ